MENFGDKIGRETFLSVFGWAVGFRCFFLGSTKKFSAENGEKTGKGKLFQKYSWNSPPSLQCAGFFFINVGVLFSFFFFLFSLLLSGSVGFFSFYFSLIFFF